MDGLVVLFSESWGLSSCTGKDDDRRNPASQPWVDSWKSSALRPKHWGQVLPGQTPLPRVGQELVG